MFTGLNNSHATPFPQPRAPAPSAPRLASLFEAVRPLHSLEHEIPRQVRTVYERDVKYVHTTC